MASNIASAAACASSPGLSPLISVIIPCYHAQAFLPEALQSVAGQSYERWELIVVEDGSHDDTESIVKGFRTRLPAHRIEFLRHPENRGVSATRNTGIAHAAGEWIAFLDHDDLWHPHHLESALGVLFETGADLSMSGVVAFQSGKNDATPWPTLELGDGWQRRLFEQNRIALSSVVVRRAVLQKCGAFDIRPEIQHCEDYDLWLRLAAADLRFAKVPEVTLRYRLHATQASARTAMMNEREWQVLSAHFSSYPAPRGLKRDRLASLALRAAMHLWSTDPLNASRWLASRLRLVPCSIKTWWLLLKSLARLAVAPRRPDSAPA